MQKTEIDGIALKVDFRIWQTELRVCHLKISVKARLSLTIWGPLRKRVSLLL